MIRSQKIAMMSGSVLAGAAALALGAEALLWSSVHAPPRAPDAEGFYLLSPSSLAIHGAGEGEDAVVRRASFLGDPDSAWTRGHGSLGDAGTAGPAPRAGH